eukprot:UN25174
MPFRQKWKSDSRPMSSNKIVPKLLNIKLSTFANLVPQMKKKQENFQVFRHIVGCLILKIKLFPQQQLQSESLSGLTLLFDFKKLFSHQLKSLNLLWAKLVKSSCCCVSNRAF